MTDNSTVPASAAGQKTKATFNGILQMIGLNVIPVAVGYLVGHFPIFNEATWFEIVAFLFSAFMTFQVWFSWKNLITWLVGIINGLKWGISQIRDAIKGGASPIIVLPFLGMLMGCSYLDSILQPSPNVVATMEASLAAADNAAMIYVQLPKCGSQTAGGSKICSDPNIVRSIATAAQNAYIAVKAAEANETASTVQAAENLIGALQAIVPATPTK